MKHFKFVSAFAAAAVFLQMGPFAAPGQAAISGIQPHTFRTILTVKDTDVRLTEQPVAFIGKTPDSLIATVFVDPSRQFQTIVGFGGAFTEAAAITWRKMSLANQQAIINAYFDSSNGHGYTLCRTTINSGDFSETNHAYDEVAGDTQLKHFSIKRANLQNVKIMAWDHNRDDMDEYANVIYSDPFASRYIWGTAISLPQCQRHVTFYEQFPAILKPAICNG